jgi:archaellum biogenesis ATPase FlaH
MATVLDLNGTPRTVDFSERARNAVPIPLRREPGDDTDDVILRPTPGQYIRSTIGLPVVRLATGIPTLDKLTRGGLMIGKMTAVGGAPNAGKTTFVTQLGHHFASRGIPVGFLAKDEDREGILYRIGQATGLRLEDLENDTDDARARLAEALEDLPSFMLRDQDEEGVTLEEFVEELTSLAAGRPAVLIIDSLQTVRTEAHAGLDDKRRRIEANVAALKAIGKRLGWLVIATCELARGAYRSRDAADRINDLAAFKETGDIEYAIAIGLVLRSVNDEPDLVDVTVPKAKRGRPEPFRLKLDFRHACFSEVPLPSEESVEQETSARYEARQAELNERVHQTILRQPGLAGREAIRAILGARRGGIQAAIDTLLGDGRIENRGTSSRPKYHATSVNCAGTGNDGPAS